MPSKDELNKLYLNQVAIGGFADYYYWSSSEYNANNARGQDFYDGGQVKFDKGNPFRDKSRITLKGHKGTIVSWSGEFYRGDKTLAER